MEKVVERGLACLKGPTDFLMKGKIKERACGRDKLASQYQRAAVLSGRDQLSLTHSKELRRGFCY
jgi:hypothetical protein